MQLSCNYVRGFKRPSTFNFGFHLNCVSKSCDHKSCYGEASVLVGMEQRDTLVYILMSIFKFCSFHKVLVTEYYNNPFLYFTFIIRKVSL